MQKNTNAMKHLSLLFLSFFHFFIFSFCSAFADESNPKTIELTDSERQLVENNNRFALNLFSKVRESQLSTLNSLPTRRLSTYGAQEPSTLLSPLGITFDLGMLNNGADGITREEIDAVLGSANVGGADAINKFCKKLLAESGTLDETTRVAIANNIYVNTASGCELLPGFVETAAQYYDATPESRDFYDGETLGVMNQWGSDHTEGMIEEAIKEEEFTPDAVSYLLNALYFKGEWTHKFNAQETRRSQFNDGKAEAQLMHQYTDFSYARNKTYQSVILPYGNKAYQMTVYLPQWGKTIDDVIDELRNNGFSQEEYGTCYVNLYLPKFETSTDMRLEDIMKSLGMPNAFEGGYGFNGFCNQNVYIGLMKQAAKIKLDEEGTEASAVTIIDVRKNGTPGYADFVADRPFLYTVSEQSTGAIFFIGQYMGEPLKNPLREIELTAEEKQLVESNNNFAFNLFRGARGEESSVMSPLSITFALGMSNNGAAGQTQQEINEVLGFGDAGADAINQFCRKLLTEAPTLDNTTAAEIANTVFVNSGRDFHLQQGFVEKANEFYDAEPTELNFFDVQNSIDIINGWANDHTHGMIPEVLNEQSFNMYAVSYLLNAIYFKGAWTSKFDKAYTREEPFNGGQTVPMMQQWEEFEYAENDLYQAVRLPYGNGAYRMTVFLPRPDKTIDDVLTGMNGKNWESEIQGIKRVNLKLPRIKTGTNLPLVDVMSELGMPSAFDYERAEFPYFGNRGVYISNMFQKAVIDLDEEGTEAAAVTVIEYSDTAIPDEYTFHADRPFFYIISEQSTGAIFFIGQYLGPDMASNIRSIDNGQLTIDNEAIYNLAGQRLTKPQRGLNIINGKRVAIK